MSALPHDGPTFHEGEVALQREAGVAEHLGRVGTQVIRPQMPEQHRDFFERLPFVVVGSVDPRLWPTASLLAAPPGFAWSPDAGTLRIDALPDAEDPFERNLRAGAPLGVLGIEPHTRRRNRVNGTVSSRDDTGFSLAVEQSFGNCPKYIQPREPRYVGSAWRGGARESDRLEAPARALVEASDTFFVASAHPLAIHPRAHAHGVDVSHRGGPPGFVTVRDATSLSIEDFQGNDFYNTLGNLLLNPAAGLLFIDFSRGDLLELDVTVEVEIAHGTAPVPPVTGRRLRFHVRGTRWFAQASPLRFGPLLSTG